MTWITQTGFVWALAAMLAYGAVHSLLAAHFIKQWAEARLGARYHQFYRAFFNIVAGVLLTLLAALALCLPDQVLYTIPYPWFIITIVTQLLTIVGLLAGLQQTGAGSFLGVAQVLRQEPADTPARLVTDGLYRWVRHPIYTATLLLIWLLPVMTANMLGLAIGATVYILVGARLEERKLEAEFGDAYRDYKRRTPMLIPGLILVVPK
jgi:protein-S-isoprenylcysteine O-methyltransferase Ste14